MNDLQILNKILNSGSLDIVFNNGLGEEHFAAYEEEFKYINKFWRKYKKVPDKETFINQFPTFEFVAVSDPDTYLVEGLQEEYLYGQCVPVANTFAKLVKENSFKAVDYLRSVVPKLSAHSSIQGVDLIKQAQKRNQARKKRDDKFFLSTGFSELDNFLIGLKRGEELLTIFARTNQGKSWLSLKIAQAVLEQGQNVVMYSGEMSDDSTGYRFDALMQHFSNVGLIRNKLEDEDAYEKYISELERLEKIKNKFIVVTPKILGGRATVSKLITICEKEQAGALIVDQLSLMLDERAKKGDDRKQRYANISEDLFAFSEQSGIPVVLAAQANRESVKDGENEIPDLQGIAGADDIAHNSSKVLAIRQKEDCVEIAIRKNRDGSKGAVVKYSWNIDRGIFEFISAEDSHGNTRTSHSLNAGKKEGARRPKEKTEVF